MTTAFQRIVYQGRLVAVVLAEQAIIDDALPAEQLRVVQAMCLYALEVQGRQRPATYDDQAAESYAREALGEGS